MAIGGKWFSGCVVFFMRNPVILVLLLLTSFQVRVIAEEQCIIRRPDNSDACFSLSDLDGRTIQVPGNTTRLDKNLIALCMEDFPNVSSARPAILFVVDQSTSMSSQNSITGAPPQDPNSIRDDAVEAAMSYLADNNSGSYGAYVEFGSQAMDMSDHYFPFVPLNSYTLPWLFSAVIAKNLGWTSYTAALNTGYPLFNSIPADAGITQKAIIFLSDGDPYVSETQMESIQIMKTVMDQHDPSQEIPIYGVFLTDNPQTNVLSQMVDYTNGSYYTISGSEPDSIIALLRNIVDEISVQGTPDQVRLTNQQNSAQAIGGEFTVTGTNTWETSTNKSIPLESGSNNILLEAIYQGSNGEPVQSAATFTVEVVPGTNQSEDSEIWNGLMTADCGPGTQLVWSSYTDRTRFDPEDPTTWFTVRDPGARLTLYPAAYDGASTTIDYSGPHNSNTVTHTASIADSGQYIDSIGFNYLGSEDGFNMVVQGNDTLLATWQHPDDPRDNATAIAIVRGLANLEIAGDTMLADAIDLYLDDPYPFEGAREIKLMNIAGDSITTAIAYPDSGTMFYGQGNVNRLMSSEGDPRIIAVYVDPVLGIEVSRDTAVLNFDVPDMPRSQALSTLQNGQFDMVRFSFAAWPQKEQTIDSVTLQWGMETKEERTLNLQEFWASGQTLWEIVLPQPFSQGLTRGSAKEGEGFAIIHGTFQGTPITRRLPLEDLVAPVVLSAWLQPNADYPELWTDLKIRVSEPVILSEENASSGFLYLRQFDLQTGEVSSQFQEKDNGVPVYRFFYEAEKAPVAEDDSIRLEIPPQVHFADSSGNQPGPNNPWVPVQLDRSGNNVLTFELQTPLIRFQPDGVDASGSQSSEHAPSPLQIFVKNQLLDREEIIFKNDSLLTSAVAQSYPEEPEGLAFLISIKLPQLKSGQSADKVRWAASFIYELLIYDHLGQFVDQSVIRIPQAQENWFNELGSMTTWMQLLPDSRRGLISESGRALGTGPYIAVLKVSAILESEQDIYSVDASGEAKLKYPQGSTIKSEHQKTYRFGYIRSGRQP